MGPGTGEGGFVKNRKCKECQRWSRYKRKEVPSVSGKSAQSKGKARIKTLKEGPGGKEKLTPKTLEI